MDKQLIVGIDRESKDKFSKIARMEGKSVSEKIREMFRKLRPPKRGVVKPERKSTDTSSKCRSYILRSRE